MPRTRHQSGSVQQRERRGKLVWVGLYRDAGGRRCITELEGAKTRSQAQSRMAEFLIPVNSERGAMEKNGNMPLAAYIEQVFIPFKMRRWKASTAGTNTGRLRVHLVRGELAEVPLSQLDRDQMQAFLDTRKQTCSKSVLDHLRFDLSDILKLAESDGLIRRNQAKVIFTPRKAKATALKRVMALGDVRKSLDVLDIRERAFVRLAIVAGMRPGEICALTWKDIEGEKATVSKRVYRGIIDTTKNSECREVYLSPLIRRDLELWKEFALPGEYVFGSERNSPLWYRNVWQRHIHPRFKKVGLEWANFHVMRRTNATLMDEAGADPKVAADQRGHDIGVSIDEYTQATLAQKAEAVLKLETLLIQ